jgi:hypothetical protein
MNFDRIILILVVVIGVAGVWANWPSSKPSVEVSPAPKVESYQRPVREGNCWRQFIGTGTKNSILVCG